MSTQEPEKGVGIVALLAAGSNGELDAHEHEEEIIESPLTIIFANRTVAFEDKKASSPEEAILALMFSGVDDATVENSHLMHDAVRYPFFSGYRGSMGDVLTYMYAAFVPKSVLEFDLYVGDTHPKQSKLMKISRGSCNYICKFLSWRTKHFERLFNLYPLSYTDFSNINRVFLYY